MTFETYNQANGIVVRRHSDDRVGVVLMDCIADGDDRGFHGEDTLGLGMVVLMNDGVLTFMTSGDCMPVGAVRWLP